MSIYACRTDGTRIKGPPSSLYATLFANGYSSRKRVHYCQLHAASAAVASTQGLRLLYIGDAAQEDVDTLPVECRVCGAHGPYTLTVYTYVKGEEERVFSARFCDQHVDEPASRVDLTL